MISWPYPTLDELRTLSERDFEREMSRLERAADSGDPDAAFVVLMVDAIVDEHGTFD